MTGRPGTRTGTSCGHPPAARAGRPRPTVRSGRRPRTGRTPPSILRPARGSSRGGGTAAAASSPTATTRSRPSRSWRPARRCGPGSPSSTPPPCPAPARRCGCRADAPMGPARRTRRGGNGGSTGPTCPGRRTPSRRTGRHGTARRSPGPPGHAPSSTDPDPGQGRSPGSGTTPPAAPAPAGQPRHRVLNSRKPLFRKG